VRSRDQTYAPLGNRHFWFVVASLLDSNQCVRFRPAGSSMSPFIRDGETVIVNPCHARRLRFGDIILYTLPGLADSSMRIHRIVGRGRRNGRDVLLTRGDSLAEVDAPVGMWQVLGRISSIEKGGWVLRLDRPLGKAINLVWSMFHCLAFPAVSAARGLLRPLHRGRCFLR
jgi:hypothetical protein